MLNSSRMGSSLFKTPHFCGRSSGPRYTTLDCKENSHGLGAQQVPIALLLPMPDANVLQGRTGDR